jgi:hypothetical protein
MLVNGSQRDELSLELESVDQNAPNTACTRPPTKYAGVVMVGVGAFSGSLRGLKLVPSKLRYLVPPTSTPEGA